MARRINLDSLPGIDGTVERSHDNGDIDMLEVMRTLKEVEYPYLVMPDHVPRHPDDEGGLQAFAFSYGYIRAMVQVVKAEG